VGRDHDLDNRQRIEQARAAPQSVAEPYRNGMRSFVIILQVTFAFRNCRLTGEARAPDASFHRHVISPKRNRTPHTPTPTLFRAKSLRPEMFSNDCSSLLSRLTSDSD